MANPDYKTLLQQIGKETDLVKKQELIEKTYIFEEQLTEEEKELFDFVEKDYIKNNPGYTNSKEYVTYTGKYWTKFGDETK